VAPGRGGLASRRLAVLAVLALSQAVGLAGAASWVWIAGDLFPRLSEILPPNRGSPGATRM
jgi:hypothetical protein